MLLVSLSCLLATTRTNFMNPSFKDKQVWSSGVDALVHVCVCTLGKARGPSEVPQFPLPLRQGLWPRAYYILKPSKAQSSSLLTRS